MSRVEPAVSLREPAPRTSGSPRARYETLLPFGAAAALLAAWQLLAWAFSLPVYIAPTPAQVARTLVAEQPTHIPDFGPTPVESFVGVLIGNTVAVVVAVTLPHSKRLEAGP